MREQKPPPVLGEGIRSGTVAVIWKCMAIVDNWLRNIPQLSTTFLFSQMIVPLDMVNALSCAATFPFTLLIHVSSTSHWCSLLLLLSVLLRSAAVLGQLSLLASTPRSPPSGAPLLLSQGNVWMCWDGRDDQINVWALCYPCYIVLKAQNQRNYSLCPLFFSFYFFFSSVLSFLLFSFFTWLFLFTLSEISFHCFPLLAVFSLLFIFYKFSVISLFLSLLYFSLFHFSPPFFVFLPNTECYRWKHWDISIQDSCMCWGTEQD